ncbi:hypothetical protein Tsubulata_028641 [Turnera subulata]|uniref:Uncharacterized protein n=1 Tax=Turnera subulata TaxID=218843 RepID=A0A9Q0J769_9ROSI|nr:hypothetical protein Tsubulata_028641 [Turnera subulata]
MENPPQPKQVQHYPVGGEIQYLFTKTLSQEDMLGLVIIGDTKKHFKGLSDELLLEVARKGLEIEIYTPNHTNWVTMNFERANKSFKLEKIGWLQVTIKSGFHVDDKISCWSLYHSEVGPSGILSLIIEKGSDERR